ncbi:hypothetical protein [Flavobacterium sp. KACC 22761]|uniref:hypothetical protein n=1 Tax=Flavobacterium sp. KACC 22761 TaxID=3092665 RepID=UPI002A74C727|nr:hypothetical protein [Flavobacterium sp. KACC 22761]WPO79719.1 hypothetical protein SCB73_04925 [Flavobacterium sp. KACC 22761]
MKKLELIQMENLEGGADSVDCVIAGAGLILGALTIGAVTGGIGLAMWGAGMGLNIVGMMRSC